MGTGEFEGSQEFVSPRGEEGEKKKVGKQA